MWKLHWGFPFSGQCHVQGSWNWEQIPPHLLVKRLQFTEAIKVPRGVVKSVRQREMHMNWSGREGSLSSSPASSAVPYRGAPGKREQGGTLLPFPPSANKAQTLWILLSFPILQQHNLTTTCQERNFPKAKCFTLDWTQTTDQITTNLLSLQNCKGLILLPNLDINHNRTGDYTDLLQAPSTRGTQCFGSILILKWFLFPYSRVGWGRVFELLLTAKSSRFLPREAKILLSLKSEFQGRHRTLVDWTELSDRVFVLISK